MVRLCADRMETQIDNPWDHCGGICGVSLFTSCRDPFFGCLDAGRFPLSCCGKNREKNENKKKYCRGGDAYSLAGDSGSCFCMVVSGTAGTDEKGRAPYPRIAGVVQKTVGFMLPAHRKKYRYFTGGQPCVSDGADGAASDMAGGLYEKNGRHCCRNKRNFFYGICSGSGIYLYDFIYR